MATFETSREDLEEGADAEQVNEDDTDESSADRYDREPGRLEARRGYIAERQERHRATYDRDRARNQDEIRKVQRQVNALAAKKRKRVKA